MAKKKIKDLTYEELTRFCDRGCPECPINQYDFDCHGIRKEKRREWEMNYEVEVIEDEKTN